MRLIFMGTPEFAVPSLRNLAEAGHEIAAAVTPPDRPRRSGSSHPAPCAVKLEATRLGLPVLQPDSVRDPGFIAQVGELAPQSIVVVAYGRILPAELLAIPPRWCINLHASILPRYRGAAPIARAIIGGEKVTGCTTMKMDRGLDTGDILLTKECAIGLLETAGELTARLAVLGADLLAETMREHARGVLEPRRQASDEATAAPPLTKEDARIDWKDDAASIACRVRGCNPWPVAAAALDGRRVQILRAEQSFETWTAAGRRPAPGEVLRADAERLLVQCGENSRLAVLELRLPGGRAMSASAAVSGRLVRAGQRFGPV